MLDLQDFVRVVSTDGPGPADWSTMAKAFDRLRPIANATEEVEQDGATLLTVLKYANFNAPPPPFPSPL